MPISDIKGDSTPGAYPTGSRVGWLEAYKRTDEPTNEFRDKSIWMDEFAGTAMFGEVWHNAAALVVIPVVCYVVFKLGGGLVSLIVIMAAGATYYKNSIRRFRRNARDHITSELVKSALENDNETTEWINNFMAKFWPIYEPVLSATVAQTVDGVVDSILGGDQKPAFLESIRLTTLTLGSKAPRVESVKAFPNTDPDVVLMDWRVSFTPTDLEDMTPRQLRTQANPKIVITIRLKNGGVGIPIVLEEMAFRGFMRFKLKLTSNFPHIKTVDFCLLEPPAIDYVLRPVGGETLGFDIAHIPGLQAFIREQIHNIIGPMMYAPNVYTLDLENIMTGGKSLTAAAGVVQFTIYEAKDLKNSEVLGNSDPYIKIRLGNRSELAQTSVKQNTQNPVWDETNMILVNNLHEVICMEIFDKDNVRKDRQLGQANFDLKSLESEAVQDDIWCKVLRNGKERGSVRIRAAYFPVQEPALAADGVTLVPVESNCGIMAVNIAQAKDISKTGKTKSHCVVYLNGKVIDTTKSMTGANPAWGADVDLFVTDLANAQIAIEVVSDDDHVIGSYGVSAKKLVKDTTDKEDWVALQGGDGKLKVTGIWKPILMGEDSTIHKPPFGVVRIQMIGARNLRNVEIGGESDPYVVITGEKNMSRGATKVINSDLNPTWNEIFYVPINSLKQSFVFECFDFQKVSKDRTLGKTEFSVSEVVEEMADKSGYVARPTVDKWAPLKQKDKDETKGELHYVVSFHPTLKIAQEATEAEKAAAAVPVVSVEGADSENPPVNTSFAAGENPLPDGTIKPSEVLDYDSGVLVVHLIGADLNKSDTYCEFYVDSDSYQYKSQHQKSRNPKWGEIADLFVKELEYSKLVIQVKEKSTLEKDPVVGIFSANVRTLLEKASAEGGEYPIMDKHGGHDKRGSFHLKFEYLPVPIQLFPRERLDNMGNLTVVLVRARNLIAADRGGHSDPYIKFELNDEGVHKSEVVKKTVNPEFENETFIVPIANRDEDKFTLEVFDWNQMSAAKSLGTATVDIRNIQLVLPNEFWIPLQNKSNQGEVLLRLSFMPEFLSSNKRASFVSSFIGGGANVIGGGGVGAVGKGLMGGISSGASVLGLNRKERSGSKSSVDAPADVPPSTIPNASAPALASSRRISITTSRSRASSSPSDGSDTVGEPGNLTIHVIEASGLLGVDKSGQSDPYVKVSVGSKTLLKTKVKKENLAPNWSEAVAIPGITGSPMTINFLVRDHNTIGSDKDLGEYNLALWEHLQPSTETTPGVYKADIWGQLSGAGKLHIALEFEPQEGSDGGKKRGLFSRK
ncbi:MAG: C2 domain-containing protein [Benniella sp.]|nr:MAG: C2 domain-containing protein [Benniella sp.]